MLCAFVSVIATDFVVFLAEEMMDLADDLINYKLLFFAKDGSSVI